LQALEDRCRIDPASSRSVAGTSRIVVGTSKIVAGTQGSLQNPHARSVAGT